MCSGTEFESTAPTATSDRGCTELTVCDPATEYESEAATGYRDRAPARTEDTSRKKDGTVEDRKNT